MTDGTAPPPDGPHRDPAPDSDPAPDGDYASGGEVLERITAGLEQVRRIMAHVVADLGEAAERGLAERLAGLPLDQLVALRGRLPHWEARRLVGAAEVLGDLPWLSARVAAGEVAWATLAVIAAQLRRVDAAARRWVDATLAAQHDTGAGLEPDALAEAVATLVDRAAPRAAKEREQRDWDTAFVAAQVGFDGRARLFGELDAATAATFLSAVDHAGRITPTTDADDDAAVREGAAAAADGGRDGDPYTSTVGGWDGAGATAGDPFTGAGRSRGARRADGLRAISASWLAGHRHTPDGSHCPAGAGDDHTGDGHTGDGDAGKGTTTAERRGGAGFPVIAPGCGCGHDVAPALPSLLVTTDVAHLAAAITGATAPADTVAAAAAQLLTHRGPVALTPTALEHLACDATLTAVLSDGTEVLGVAAPVATIPAELRAALVARDRGCRFPGCRRGPSQCHAHHVVYRRNLGPTLLENLALLCDHHHRLVHYRGWKLTLHPDGTLDARFRGHTHTTRPRTRQVTLAAGPPPRHRRRRRSSATASPPAADPPNPRTTTTAERLPPPPPGLPF